MTEQILQYCWYDVKELAEGQTELVFFDGAFFVAEYILDNGVAKWRFRKNTLTDKEVIIGAIRLEATEPEMLRGSYCEIRTSKNEQALYCASDIIEGMGYSFPIPCVFGDITKLQIRIIWDKAPSLDEKSLNQLKFKLMGKPGGIK